MWYGKQCPSSNLVPVRCNYQCLMETESEGIIIWSKSSLFARVIFTQLNTNLWEPGHTGCPAPFAPVSTAKENMGIVSWCLRSLCQISACTLLYNRTSSTVHQLWVVWENVPPAQLGRTEPAALQSIQSGPPKKHQYTHPLIVAYQVFHPQFVGWEEWGLHPAVACRPPAITCWWSYLRTP